MKPIQVTSFKNIAIKELKKLRQRNKRQAAGRFVVEGVREVGRALCANFKPVGVYYCTDILVENDRKLVDSFDQVQHYSLSVEVFNQVVTQENRGGIVAVFAERICQLEELESSSKPIVICDQIEKPGNLGAILRVACATGCRAVILTGPSLDPYNPHVIRNSTGACFSVPTIHGDYHHVQKWLQDQSYEIYTSMVNADAKSLFQTSFSSKVAIVIGSEDDGVGEFWSQHSEHSVYLPMNEGVDSLNAAMTAGILLYEYARQKA